MNKFLLGVAVCSLLSLPAFAVLKPGDTAPNISAPAALAGKEFTFSLDHALRKGPVVLYFYPSAYTKGCDLEAHTFAQEKEQFTAAGATIIGVSADSIARLKVFSSDPDYCAGKFPVVSDQDAKIAASYHLATSAHRAGMVDVRGNPIDHDFIERVTFVIGKDRRIIAAFSSSDDHLTPDEHVKKSLEAVQQLASK